MGKNFQANGSSKQTGVVALTPHKTDFKIRRDKD
jgi:hypothetical protein